MESTGYPDVKINNTTPFNANGKVEYRSFVCSDDNYGVGGHQRWSNSRGLCLITRITATVQTPQGNVNASSYDSDGTSYSNFAIIQTGPLEFAVTRVVDGKQDLPPADYVEPTAKQKD
ncbi:MAG TPA: hypothetical protein VHS96_15305 [Bacteroidia bacterium]|nr:hypothetical protein [Bacteroidia bacterium]